MYFYMITMNKNQEPEAVDFGILGRSGALIKKVWPCLLKVEAWAKTFFSVSVRLNQLFDVRFSIFTSRPYPGSGLILGWLASVLVIELHLPIFPFYHTPVCSVLSVLKITPTLPSMYGLNISGKEHFVDK